MKQDKQPIDWKERNSRPRVSAAIRNALAIHVAKGILPTEAAREAGVREETMLAALEREHVQDVLKKLRAQHAMQIEALQHLMQGEAIKQAADLMKTATSEQVRMRAIEFFRGTPKQAPPTGPSKAKGAPGPIASPTYTYTKPEDKPSSAQAAQGTETKRKAGDK